MVDSKMMSKIGTWAFLIGIIIALIVGIYQAWLIETEGSTDLGGMIAWILVVH